MPPDKVRAYKVNFTPYPILRFPSSAGSRRLPPPAGTAPPLRPGSGAAGSGPQPSTEWIPPRERRGPDRARPAGPSRHQRPGLSPSDPHGGSGPHCPVRRSGRPDRGPHSPVLAGRDNPVLLGDEERSTHHVLVPLDLAEEDGPAALRPRVDLCRHVAAGPARRPSADGAGKARRPP